MRFHYVTQFVPRLIIGIPQVVHRSGLILSYTTGMVEQTRLCPSADRDTFGTLREFTTLLAISYLNDIQSAWGRPAARGLFLLTSRAGHLPGTHAGLADGPRERCHVLFLKPPHAPPFSILKINRRSQIGKEYTWCTFSPVRLWLLYCRRSKGLSLHLEILCVHPEARCLVTGRHHLEKPLLAVPFRFRLYKKVAPAKCSLHGRPFRTYTSYQDE